MKKRKIKVAFLIAEKFPEPIGSFLLDQICGIIDLGIEVQIFVIGKKQDTKNNLDQIKKYKIIEKTIFLNIPENKILRLIKSIPLFLKNPYKGIKLINYFKYGKISLTLIPLYSYYKIKKYQKKFDILHCHFGPMGLVGLSLKNLNMNFKLVTSFHGGDVNSYPKIAGNNVYKILFKEGDLFTVNSNFTKSKIEELGCKDEKKIEVLPMIINFQKFYPKKRKKTRKLRS
jgi:colanic acid/amylovoran biosynthesis glycosyltransferase